MTRLYLGKAGVVLAGLKRMRPTSEYNGTLDQVFVRYQQRLRETLE